MGLSTGEILYEIKFTVMVPEGFDPEGDPEAEPIKIVFERLEGVGIDLQEQMEDAITLMIQDGAIPNGSYVVESFSG